MCLLRGRELLLAGAISRQCPAHCATSWPARGSAGRAGGTRRHCPSAGCWLWGQAQRGAVLCHCTAAPCCASPCSPTWSPSLPRALRVCPQVGSPPRVGSPPEVGSPALAPQRRRGREGLTPARVPSQRGSSPVLHSSGSESE